MSNDDDEFGPPERLRSIDPDKSICELDPFKVQLNSETEREVSAEVWAKMAVDFWRIRRNAATGLHALWILTVARIDLPKDLRDWFIDSLNITLIGGGDITMDRAFGLTDASGNHSAFTEHLRDCTKLTNSHNIHSLVVLHGFSASLASRLEHEKQRHAKVSGVLSAATMRTQYSRVKGSLDAPLVLRDKSKNADFSLRILNRYDVPGLDPKDKEKLDSAIAAVQLIKTTCTAR